MIPGTVNRIMDQLAAHPVGIYDATWELLHWNPLFAAAFGEPASLRINHRNMMLAHFEGALTANIGVRTLSRRFHAETGQSPMEWVSGVRIRHAQELLETTDHGIERIARHVGFASPGNFRTHFRRTVGVTPNGYRSTFTGKTPVTVAARCRTGRQRPDR
jgi:AraC-like DNA-binding protein